MSLHLALPQTKTKEELAAWIKENSIEGRFHEEKVDYTHEEIENLKTKLAEASIEIDKIKSVDKAFKTYLKDGTPCMDPENGVYEDVRIVIPGTRGLKILEANRSFAGLQIDMGYHVVTTELYAIPFSKTGKVHFFDIEANHWEQYDYKMNPLQVQKYGAPLFKKSATEEEII